MTEGEEFELPFTSEELIAWRRTHYYTLDEHGEPEPCEDLDEWGRWFQRSRDDGSRTVAVDHVGPWTVSTVFIGMNHDPFSYISGTPPILWETMIFSQFEDLDDPFDGMQWRYTSKPDALAGHEDIVRRLRAGQDLNADEP